MIGPAQTFAAFVICWRDSGKRSRGRRKDDKTRANFRRGASSFGDVRQRIALKNGAFDGFERDQRPVITEANNSERLILANHRETKHFLIEIDGTLQIRNLNADVVDSPRS